MQKSLVIGMLAGAMAWTVAPRVADACGGCFVPPAENTQVTGHRMILSVSPDQTTLYDQIEYSGNPEEFAWVLPTRGIVDVGISSDLVFNQLGFDTTVNVSPPPLNCDWSLCENNDSAFGSSASSGAGGGGGQSNGGVDVVASEVVGPFETVQLQATDPQALNDWLDGHGYNIPAEIEPIIADYVNNGFGFLAMKLVPGVGVEKMQPVRISTPGAAPTLPLKMVAAGTGNTTTMTLYVVGEGRYEPANFPSFSIAEDDLVWDWDANLSNYRDLRQAGYDESQGFAWQTESSLSYSVMGFRSTIINVLDFVGVEGSGYEATDDKTAYDVANEDLDVLFAGMDPSAVMVTRLRAELSRAALAEDLTLTASSDQSALSTNLQAKKATGTWPSCPCGGGSSDPNAPRPLPRGNNLITSGAGCNVEAPTGDTGGFGGLALAGIFGLWAMRRRRSA